MSNRKRASRTCAFVALLSSSVLHPEFWRPCIVTFVDSTLGGALFCI